MSYVYNNNSNGVCKFQLKLGHKIFVMDETDTILDNGRCYIVISQEYYSNWSSASPSIVKAVFKRLLKQGLIFKAVNSESIIAKRYGIDGTSNFAIYRFNAEVMSKMSEYAVDQT